MAYNLSIEDEEMEVLRQLFNSQIAVTLATVEVIADLKRKVVYAAKAPVLPAVEEVTILTPSS